MLDKRQVLERISMSTAVANSPFHGAPLGDLDFQNYTFDGAVNFSGALFTGETSFASATFRQFVTFDSAVFHKPVTFAGCTFEKGAAFSLASFRTADFFQARFSHAALFWRTFFHGKAHFEQMKVSKADWLPQDHDGQANFSWARFHDDAVLTYAEFEWPVYFYRTLFRGDVYLDQCRFGAALLLNGKQNEALFPRFDLVDPETVRNLEAYGIFRPDTERHRLYRNARVSEFVCFNNVLSQADLIQKLEELSDISQREKEIILAEWQEGARKMFADNRLLTFRGATFHDLAEFSCKYTDFDRVTIDREIAGTAEQRKTFEQRLKSDSFDLFVSHASEDKAGLARPLTQKLREMGYVVWLDESQIEVGDELMKSLDAGIQRARFGLVVLSPAFIRKKWTQYEVEQLLELSRISGKKLLFLWHGVNEEQVRAWSPMLADRVAFSTERYTLDDLAVELARAMR